MNRFLSTLIIVTVPLAVTAQQVSLQTAMETAVQFRLPAGSSQKVQSRDGNVDDVTLSYIAQTGNDNDFYVFNYPNDGGFIIVSADTRTTNPVLAYSTQGSFHEDSIPDNAAFLLSTYSQQIQSLRKYDHKGQAVLDSPQTPNVVVEPLIKTRWKQNDPINGMCPISPVDGKRCVTGCTPLAIAQIMNYWQWPERGHGYHYNAFDTTLCVDFDQSVYDWDNIHDTYDSGYDSVSLKAVQKLLYDCGIAMNTVFASNGSATYDHFVLSPMRTYFDYKTTASVIYYDEIDQDDPYYVWITELKSELDLGRPVIYCGDDQTQNIGHAFICDGYDDCNYFHFNFGWNGKGDGYYLCTSIKPDNAPFNFDSYFRMYIGIEPDRNEGYNDGQIGYTKYDDSHVELNWIIMPYDNKQTLTIPNTITENGTSKMIVAIGSQTFWGNNSITDIVFPWGLGIIGPYAFFNCNNLTRVEIPSSLYNCQPGAFSACNNLKELTVNERNIYFYSPQGSNAVIEKDTKRLVQGCNYTTIPDDVKIIGENAFEGLYHITSVTLPDKVTAIEDDAFRSCTALKTVTLDSNLKTIGNNAFQYCSSLTDVYCQAATPPQLHSSSFPAGVTIHVTSEAAANYRGNKTWSLFNIVDDLTDNVELPAMTPDKDASQQHYYDIMGRKTDSLRKLRVGRNKKYFFE